MAENLLIIGAGYTGQRLAARTAQSGWQVRATSRKTSTAAALNSHAQVHLWDANDDVAALADCIDAETTVVYSVPTLYRDIPAQNEHLRLPRDVLSLATKQGAARVIYLSSTSVYGDHGGEWVDEDTERLPDTPLGIMRRDIEDLVLSWSAPPACNVVRIAGIYGPGRSLKDYAASGRYSVVDPDKVTNRIHVDDLVTIILAVATQKPDHGRAFIAADGHPIRVGDLIDHLVNAGMPRPPETTIEAYQTRHGVSAAARWRTTTRCRNDRVINELGVEFAFPDVFAFYT